MSVEETQRYECARCGHGTLVEGVHPQNGPRTIRTGCDNCGSIRQHVAVGREGPCRRCRW